MDGESLRVRMRAPADLAPYIVKKGYIAIDGTSLTVTEADPATGIFAVMLVPHTQRCIVLPARAVGDRVNLGALPAAPPLSLPRSLLSSLPLCLPVPGPSGPTRHPELSGLRAAPPRRGGRDDQGGDGGHAQGPAEERRRGLRRRRRVRGRGRGGGGPRGGAEMVVKQVN